ncbi:acyl-CoA dehydrogenase family protein [Actinomycetospora termitidis]|uniref:Acyl-CoA dehydrogenase family protein n=1 Tax=Actinomycetospora termitidis TaxID=3053470 RepID=A0ABT7MD55_9PSEU|nr:acyl-CoA dehydrogenase family protein [Actinomycetospora sp. Odt1-22]MDL5158603.1 acyl-CoA dehydrogenase family protein [Actinomycetospora sp. Odt1-22]
MTAVHQRPPRLDGDDTCPVRWARSIAGELAAGAVATEEARTPTREVVEQLRDAGLFSLTLPKALGGAEADPATVMAVVEEVSWADPSVGWALMIGQGSGFLGWGSQELGQRVVGTTPDPLIACALAPMGDGTLLSAEETGGDEPGYRLSGRWAINSGCRHADWFIAAFAKKTEGVDSPQWGEDVVRFAVLPADRVRVLDTWHVLGLRGSGSDDVEIDGVEVPHSMTFSPFFEAGEHDGPLYRLSYFAFLMTMMGGFSAGLARRAVDEVFDLAGTPGGPDLADTDTQVELWRLDADRRAARLLLADATARVWDEVRASGAAAPETRALYAGAVQHSQRVAERVVDGAFALVGAAGLHDDHPLQRTWRDVHAAGAHLAFGLVAERRMARVVYLGDHSMQYMI